MPCRRRCWKKTEEAHKGRQHPRLPTLQPAEPTEGHRPRMASNPRLRNATCQIVRCQAGTTKVVNPSSRKWEMYLLVETGCMLLFALHRQYLDESMRDD